MKTIKFRMIPLILTQSLIFSFLAVLLTVIGCKEGGSSGKKSDHKEKPAINWHAKGIESALALSKKENRPLFVYWGAEWCPPCSVVKATVFKDGDFIQATKKFISVYLDGDTESAQQWGEKLNAAGYPTLMVLNPAGKEVVRFSSEMSPKEFAEALNSVYDNLHPIGELIANVLKKDSGAVEQKTWQIISGYSWGQSKKLMKKMDWADTFRKLEKKIPAKFKVEKNRLFLNGFLALTEKLEKGEKLSDKLSDKEISRYQMRLKQMVSEVEGFKKHYKILCYYSAEIAQNLYPEKNEERDAFIASFKESLTANRDGLAIGSHARMIGFYPLIELAGIKGESLPQSEKDLIKREMLQAVAKIDSSYEQVFISSGSSYILRKAGLSDVARKVLLSDIKNSKTPYYAMASLASLEKKEGNKEEALKWIERAYNTSKGNATRLQWGSNYLIYMIDLAPKKKDKILRELQKYYRVHLKLPDAFMGRNKKRLSRVAGKIKKWGEAKAIRRDLKTLRQQWLESCETKSKTKTDYYRKGCRKYFSELI